MKFKINVSRRWTEYGEIIIEADNEDEAREEATEMLSEDHPKIQWEEANMEPGESYVESCESVD